MNLRKTLSVLFVPAIFCLSFPSVLSAEPNIQRTDIMQPDSVTIGKAMEAGFRNFLSHSDQGIWTERDEQILQLLQQDIPSTLDGVRNSILDVADTFAAQCRILARAIYANQNKYPQPHDWSEASVYAGTWAIHASVQTKTLEPNVLQILLMEAVKQNGNQIPQKNEDVDSQFWVNLVIYALNNAR